MTCGRWVPWLQSYMYCDSLFTIPCSVNTCYDVLLLQERNGAQKDSAECLSRRIFVTDVCGWLLQFGRSDSNYCKEVTCAFFSCMTERLVFRLLVFFAAAWDGLIPFLAEMPTLTTTPRFVKHYGFYIAATFWSVPREFGTPSASQSQLFDVITYCTCIMITVMLCEMWILELLDWLHFQIICFFTCRNSPSVKIGSNEN